MIIDSHTHLDFSEFDADRIAVISQSFQKGVRKMVIVGVQPKNYPQIFNLVQNHDCLYAAYGVHPFYCNDSLSNLTDYLQTAKCCAVGEIGLDYICKHSRQLQQQVFITQLKLANHLNLPAILHVRKSHTDVIAILKKIKLTKGGVVHAFSGSFEQAQEYIKLGFCLGFGGVATYPQSSKLRHNLAELPLQNIVLETDSPFLSPIFAPKKRNTPANLPQICEILANICQVSPQNLAHITSQNCIRILDI